MTKVFFQPWIGKNYNNEGFHGKKILILGESHYHWVLKPVLDANTTIECIEEQLEGNYTKAFWTKIVKAFLGRMPNLAEKRDFWNSISYYNFIQQDVGKAPRIRPTKLMWEEGIEPFYEVINSYQPDYMFVLGSKLWQKILELENVRGPEINLNPHAYVYLFNLKTNKKVIGYGMLHPSAGFNGMFWHNYIQKVLKIEI